MKYKKFRSKRKSTRRKGYKKRGGSFKNKVRKAVMSFAESKSRTISLIGGVTGLSLNDISPVIPIGNTVTDRIGNEIQFTGVDIIQNVDMVAPSPNPCYVRLFIGRAKANGGAAAVGDFPQPGFHWNMSYREKYIVWYDKTFCLGPLGSDSTPVSKKILRFRKKLKLTGHFVGAATNCSELAIYHVLVFDNVLWACNLNVQTRYYFKDI